MLGALLPQTGGACPVAVLEPVERRAHAPDGIHRQHRLGARRLTEGEELGRAQAVGRRLEHRAVAPGHRGDRAPVHRPHPVAPVVAAQPRPRRPAQDAGALLAESIDDLAPHPARPRAARGSQRHLVHPHDAVGRRGDAEVGLRIAGRGRQDEVEGLPDIRRLAELLLGIDLAVGAPQGHHGAGPAEAPQVDPAAIGRARGDGYAALTNPRVAANELADLDLLAEVAVGRVEQVPLVGHGVAGVGERLPARGEGAAAPLGRVVEEKEQRVLAAVDAQVEVLGGRIAVGQADAAFGHPLADAEDEPAVEGELGFLLLLEAANLDLVAPARLDAPHDRRPQPLGMPVADLLEHVVAVPQRPEGPPQVAPLAADLEEDAEAARAVDLAGDQLQVVLGPVLVGRQDQHVAALPAPGPHEHALGAAGAVLPALDLPPLPGQRQRPRGRRLLEAGVAEELGQEALGAWRAGRRDRAALEERGGRPGGPVEVHDDLGPSGLAARRESRQRRREQHQPQRSH